MKSEEKLRAIQMRLSGHPYSKIQENLGVSKSSLSLWLRNVELTQFATDRILKGRERSRARGAASKKEKRLSDILDAQISARQEFPILRNKPIFFTGLALYWAEGDKNSQERVKFTNSDPKLISLMMKWFREICLVEETRFRIGLHVHNLQSNKEAVMFWGNTTGIPRSQFHKPYVKKTSLGYRKNPLYNGTCSIVVHSRYLFRKIMEWEKLLFENLTSDT